jgi:hypothetical protein
MEMTGDLVSPVIEIQEMEALKHRRDQKIIYGMNAS